MVNHAQQTTHVFDYLWTGDCSLPGSLTEVNCLNSNTATLHWSNYVKQLQPFQVCNVRNLRFEHTYATGVLLGHMKDPIRHFPPVEHTLLSFSRTWLSWLCCSCSTLTTTHYLLATEKYPECMDRRTICTQDPLLCRRRSCAVVDSPSSL